MNVITYSTHAGNNCVYCEHNMHISAVPCFESVLYFFLCKQPIIVITKYVWLLRVYDSENIRFGLADLKYIS